MDEKRARCGKFSAKSTGASGLCGKKLWTGFPQLWKTCEQPSGPPPRGPSSFWSKPRGPGARSHAARAACATLRGFFGRCRRNVLGCRLGLGCVLDRLVGDRDGLGGCLRYSRRLRRRLLGTSGASSTADGSAVASASALGGPRRPRARRPGVLGHGLGGLLAGAAGARPRPRPRRAAAGRPAPCPSPRRRLRPPAVSVASGSSGGSSPPSGTTRIRSSAATSAKISTATV